MRYKVYANTKLKHKVNLSGNAAMTLLNIFKFISSGLLNQNSTFLAKETNKQTNK